MAKGSLDIHLSGYAPARRDVELEIVSEANGDRQRIKPFLDGSAKVRNLAPGSYEVHVLHPNVVGGLVELKRVRLFDGLPTKVRLPLPEELFRDVPEAQPVEADLAPVATTASSSRELASEIEGKRPGDPIRSEDWNAMAAAVGDLAGAVVELTRLVTAQGHPHPLIEARIDAIDANMRRFSDHFGRQLAQMQRRIQALSTKRQVDDLFGVATEIPPAIRERFTGALANLDEAANTDVVRWGVQKKGAYQQLFDAMLDLREAQPDPTGIDEADSFDFLMKVAAEETSTSQPRTIEGEVAHFENLNQKTGGQMFTKGLG